MPIDVQAKIDLLRTDPSFSRTLLGQPIADDEYLHVRLGQDYKRYLDMARDPEVRRDLGKRRNAILGRRLLIEAAGDSEESIRAKLIAEAIARESDYETICENILSTGQLIGFSVVRLNWKLKKVDVGEEEVELLIAQHEYVPQDRFTFIYHQPDKTDIPTATGEALDPKTDIIVIDGYELRLLTLKNPIWGERCPKSRFICYSFDGTNPWGLGLGFSTFPWFEVKRKAMQAWLLQSDRIGSPPAIGTHPPEYTEQDPASAVLLRKFDNFLRASSPNGWGRFPKGFEVEWKGGVSTESGSVHERLIKLSDAQIAKAIIGEMPYSDKDSGSYGANASQVEDREMNVTDADCNILDRQMYVQFWESALAYNAPDMPRPSIRRETFSDRRAVETENEQERSRNSRATADQALIMAGFKPDDKYVKETYGEGWTFVDKDAQGGAPPVPSEGQPSTAPPGSPVEPASPVPEVPYPFSEFRASTKLVDFAVAYGASPGAIARLLECKTRTEAIEVCAIESLPVASLLRAI